MANWTKPSRSNRLLMAGGPPRQWKQKELGRAPAVLQYMYCRMGATSGVLRELLDLKRAWQGRAVSVGTPRPPSWDAIYYFLLSHSWKQAAGRETRLALAATDPLRRHVRQCFPPAPFASALLPPRAGLFPTPPAMNRDYETLNVRPSATDAEVAAAFRRGALRYVGRRHRSRALPPASGARPRPSRRLRSRLVPRGPPLHRFHPLPPCFPHPVHAMRSH